MIDRDVSRMGGNEVQNFSYRFEFDNHSLLMTSASDLQLSYVQTSSVMAINFACPLTALLLLYITTLKNLETYPLDSQPALSATPNHVVPSPPRSQTTLPDP